MKALLALAAVFALSAAAPPEPTGPHKWSDAIPPERFRGVGPALVIYVHPRDVALVCNAGTPPAGSVVVACTRDMQVDNQTLRVIVMPDPCPFADAGDYYARVACHENAHLFHNWEHQTQ